MTGKHPAYPTGPTPTITVGALIAALLKMVLEGLPIDAPVDIEGNGACGGVKATSYWGRAGVLITTGGP